MPPTSHDLLQKFQHLSVWRRGDTRAPHKPLLILLALGRCLRGEERLVSFREVDEKLRRLLLEFGPSRKSVHPEYPFWRLQTDGVWVVESSVPLVRRKGKDDARKSELLKHEVHGGFTEEIQRALAADPELLHQVALTVLEEHFPETLHEDILSEVGLERRSGVDRRKRDPRFREKILRAYQRRCSVCSYSLQLANSPVGLEAAHIKWHQAGGPDIEANGLALCCLHHKLFDRGVFTVSTKRVVLVSQDVHGDDDAIEHWLLRHSGQELREPVSEEYLPDQGFLAWHEKQVFKGPARPLARG